MTSQLISMSSSEIRGLQTTFSLSFFGTYKDGIVELVPNYFESSSSSESSESSNSSVSTSSSSPSSSSTRELETTFSNSSLSSLNSSSSISSNSSISSTSEIEFLKVVGTANEKGELVDGLYYYDGIVNGKKSFKHTDGVNEFFILWSSGKWVLKFGGHIVGNFLNICEEEDLPVGFNSYVNPSIFWSGGTPITSLTTCVVDSYPDNGINQLTVAGTTGFYYGFGVETDKGAWLNNPYYYICMKNGKKCFMNYVTEGITNATMFILWGPSNKWSLANRLNTGSEGSSTFSNIGVEGLPYGPVDLPPGTLASEDTYIVTPV